MIPLLCNSSAIRLPKSPLFHKIHHSRHAHGSPFTFRIAPKLSTPLINAAAINSSDAAEPRKQPQQQLRTLFPGGFKRPEIKVPTLVLRLNADEVLGNKSVVDLIDVAVSKHVGVVVLHGGDGSGGTLYEAACLLKSVVRDRAYLLVAERVDIAAAVGASGVVLSDQGLPAIVARNMMMESKSESVNLPIIARNVQTANSALYASSSEGADFIILGNAKYIDVPLNSLCQQVKVPIFTMIDFLEEGTLVAAASNFLQSGASGFVISLEDMKLFNDPVLSKLFSTVSVINKRTQDGFQSSNKQKIVNADKRFYGNKGIGGLTRLEEWEKQLIEIERLVLLEAITVIRKAAPLMEEVSLLVDAVSRLNEPFLLVIVGEFNSGKSTVINALLGRRYLKEGVVPTTNEITLLCYSEIDSEKQAIGERYPDGQFICYLPAPFLKEINVVDTPGTNVILQRQQRLTEEFVPRADLLIFVISADRPLTESEVAFLRYIQQWKKKVVFVLNKSDIYQNAGELEEATAFIKENAQMLLNAENVTLYPVSARSALEAKLAASSDAGNNYEELLSMDPRWKTSSFNELEKFLFSFLDRSTDRGMERMRLKLETPIGIADRLLTACESLVREEFEYANQDLVSLKEILNSVKDYTMKLENESISWRKQTLSLIDTAKARAVKLVDTTLQLSNLDLVTSYVFKGENSGPLPAASKVQNDIIIPAFFDVQRLLGTYLLWLQSNNDREVRLYKESFEKRWPEFVDLQEWVPTETKDLQVKGKEHSMQVLNNFSATLATKHFEQEVREVVLGTFGGLGAAGLSASLLTSVLPTTLEDLLALGLCSAGGLLAISNFPVRRKEVADKVKRAADALARELEEAMNKDLLQTTENLKHFVERISRPYQDSAQHRLNRLSSIQDELMNVNKEILKLQIEIQNLHVS